MERSKGDERSGRKNEDWRAFREIEVWGSLRAQLHGTIKPTKRKKGEDSRRGGGL